MYDFILKRLNEVETNLLDRMDKLMLTLNDLKAKVNALTSAVAAERALVKGLADLIRQNVNDPAALQSLADQIDAGTDGLLADVAANTDLVTGTTPAP